MKDRQSDIMISCNNKSYDTIDLLKFIGSILIFTMHLRLFTDTNINLAIQLLARWCVPFFFIISSFFLFKNSKNGIISTTTLSKYVKRVFYLYFLWLIINTPSILFDIYNKVIKGDISLLWFIKNTLLSDSFLGSWFLLSSIFSAYVIYRLSKRFSSWVIILLTFPIYVICVLASVYGNILPDPLAFILQKTLCFPLNIFGGCFYFSIGKCLADNYEKIKVVSKAFVLFLTLLSYVTYCAEVFVAKNLNYLYSTDFSFSVAFVGLSFVLIGITFNTRIKYHLSLRKMSTIIYCAQGNVLMLRAILESKLLHKDHDILMFIIMSLIMTGIVLLVLFMQKKTKWKWMYYLS